MTSSTPSEIRKAYNLSHRNSAIQRKFPRIAELEAAGRRGDFEDAVERQRYLAAEVKHIEFELYGPNPSAPEDTLY